MESLKSGGIKPYSMNNLNRSDSQANLNGPGVDHPLNIQSPDSWNGRGISPANPENIMPSVEVDSVNLTSQPTVNTEFWYQLDNKNLLSRDLEANKLMQWLWQEEVINDEDKQEIAKIRPKNEKRAAEKLMAVVQTRFESGNHSRRCKIIEKIFEYYEGGVQEHLTQFLNSDYRRSASSDLGSTAASVDHRSSTHHVQLVTNSLSQLQVVPEFHSRQPSENADLEQASHRQAPGGLLKYPVQESTQ